METQSSKYAQAFGTVITGAIIVIAILLIGYLIWYLVKNIPKDTAIKPAGRKQDANKTEAEIEEERKKKEEEDKKKKSDNDAWKETFKNWRGVIILLVILIVLWLFARNSRMPAYKQVVEKETTLESDDEVIIRVAKGDSLYLKTKHLPHLVVWQGRNEHDGKSRHYSGKDKIVIFRTSRVVKVYSCEKHGYPTGTLIYTIYKP